MVHHELVEYISTALKGGVAEAQVVQALSGVGWTIPDIQEALGVVKGETKNTDASFQSVIQRASQEATPSTVQPAQAPQASPSSTNTATQNPTSTAPISGATAASTPSKHHTLAIVLILLLMAAFIGGGLYSYTLYRARSLARQAPPQTEQAPLVPRDIATPRELFSEPATPLIVALNGTISKSKDAHTAKVAPLIFTHLFEESPESDSAAPNPDASYMYIFKKAGKTLTQGPLHLAAGKTPTFSERARLDTMPDTLTIIETGSGASIYEVQVSSDPLPTLTLKNIVFESPTTTLSWVSSASSSLFYYAEISNNRFAHTAWNASQEPSDPHTITVASKGVATASSTYGIIENNTLSIPALGLIAGDIQVAIYASDGFRTVSAFSKKISIPDQPRKISLKIHSPRQPLKETTLTLSASTSPILANTAVRWVSSTDGVLFQPSATSSGTNISCSNLTPGKHTVSGVATTQRGFVASSTIVVTIPDPKKIDPVRYAGWSPTPQCK